MRKSALVLFFLVNTLFIHAQGIGFACSVVCTTCDALLPCVACICLAPLPVDLDQFDARMDNQNNVLISWSTSHEIDNSHFTIEKSNDGVSFSELTNINGAGNSENHIKYSFIDINPELGTSYYRLKQTDFNGEYKYFNIVSVKNEIESIQISTKENQLQIDLVSDHIQKSTIIIQNELGQVLYFRNHIENKIIVPISFHNKQIAFCLIKVGGRNIFKKIILN